MQLIIMEHLKPIKEIIKECTKRVIMKRCAEAGHRYGKQINTTDLYWQTQLAALWEVKANITSELTGKVLHNHRQTSKSLHNVVWIILNSFKIIKIKQWRGTEYHLVKNIQCLREDGTLLSHKNHLFRNYKYLPL